MFDVIDSAVDGGGGIYDVSRERRSVKRFRWSRWLGSWLWTSWGWKFLSGLWWETLSSWWLWKCRLLLWGFSTHHWAWSASELQVPLFFYPLPYKHSFRRKEERMNEWMKSEWTKNNIIIVFFYYFMCVHMWSPLIWSDLIWFTHKYLCLRGPLSCQTRTCQWCPYFSYPSLFFFFFFSFFSCFPSLFFKFVFFCYDKR